MNNQQKLQLIGQRIPGSKLVRDFCVGCGQPIRVFDPGKENACTDCCHAGHPAWRAEFIPMQEATYHGSRFHGSEW